MNSSAFSFSTMANWSPLKSHASALAAYLARHDNQFWSHLVVDLSLQSLSMPSCTSRSTISNDFVSTVTNLMSVCQSVVCFYMKNFQYFTWKIVGMFCRGRTKKWNLAFGNLSATTTTSSFDMIQLLESFSKFSSPSDQLPILLRPITKYETKVNFTINAIQ